jgi:hypothetical protein
MKIDKNWLSKVAQVSAALSSVVGAEAAIGGICTEAAVDPDTLATARVRCNGDLDSSTVIQVGRRRRFLRPRAVAA